MKLIPLTQGKFAMVDDVDYTSVNLYKWYAHARKGAFYAVRNTRRSDGSRTLLYLHQFLLPGSPEIDHRDGDGLNNQRHNLRPASRTQNQRGFKRKRLGASSGFRGVCWASDRNNWRASIMVGGKQKNLGGFSLESDAARAYDTAARDYFGKFASPNFPKK